MVARALSCVGYHRYVNIKIRCVSIYTCLLSVIPAQIQFETTIFYSHFLIVTFFTVMRLLLQFCKYQACWNATKVRKGTENGQTPTLVDRAACIASRQKVQPYLDWQAPILKHH